MVPRRVQPTPRYMFLLACWQWQGERSDCTRSHPSLVPLHGMYTCGTCAQRGAAGTVGRYNQRRRGGRRRRRGAAGVPRDGKTATAALKGSAARPSLMRP